MSFSIYSKKISKTIHVRKRRIEGGGTFGLTLLVEMKDSLLKYVCPPLHQVMYEGREGNTNSVHSLVLPYLGEGCMCAALACVNGPPNLIYNLAGALPPFTVLILWLLALASL